MSWFLLKDGSSDRLLKDGGTDKILIDLPAFVLAPSANVPAGGGTATTARLTPPSGKTTGNFEGGLQSDDTNPLSGLDLGAGAYTELEWAVMATHAAVVSTTYEFRVTAGGQPLEQYGQVPKWTIGAAGPAQDTPEGYGRPFGLEGHRQMAQLFAL